jgi:hypothetical protein
MEPPAIDVIIEKQNITATPETDLGQATQRKPKSSCLIVV